jgi:flagellar motor switch protein FliG
MPSTPEKAGEKAKTKLRPVDQAAILLMSLGEQDAAEVLKHMGPKEVQRIGAAMTQLNNVQQADVQAVMGNFLEEVRTLTGLGVGADGYIRKMLVTALGEDKANGLIDRILLGGNTTGLDTLKWMDARSVADIIRNEHPQIQAIVIAYLDADQSAEVLTFFPEKVRLDIMMRVASLDTVQPSALQELNDILEKQFSGNAASQTKAMGGYKVAAEIMNNLDGSIEADLMDSIKEVDEDMGNQIQDLMFVFDNLKDVEDRGSFFRSSYSRAQRCRRGTQRKNLQKYVQACCGTFTRRFRNETANAFGRCRSSTKRNSYHCTSHGRFGRNYVGW